MDLNDIVNPRELLRLTKAALDKARSQRERVAELWGDLHALTELVTAWARREYTVVPWRTIATAVGALIYFINPMDAMPDVVPAVGYLDDGAVLAFVASSLRQDIDSFQAWKEERIARARRINPSQAKQLHTAHL
ncbi:MAG TPA: YkvA family protein [Terriglobales bacterium]|nr:YkvA family protein [Terriglobales bacterium]